MGIAKAFTPVKRLAGSVSKRLSPQAKRRLGTAAVVGGAGAVVTGAHVASYKVNKKRAQQGKGPSYHFGGVSGVAGYHAGMKKSAKKR